MSVENSVFLDRNCDGKTLFKEISFSCCRLGDHKKPHHKKTQCFWITLKIDRGLKNPKFYNLMFASFELLCLPYRQLCLISHCFT